MIDLQFLGWGDLLSSLLIYLAIGVAIVLSQDPFAYLDFVTRHYLARFCRLPPRGFLVLAIIWAVVMWPRTFMILAGMTGR